MDIIRDGVEVTLLERVGKAELALMEYLIDNEQDALIDLLTDLMHWCDTKDSGVDFNALLSLAKLHHEEEREGE